MFCYNEETQKQQYTYIWRHLSRNNYYFFSTEDGERDIVFFIDLLRVKSILDYGCGNNDLSYVLGKTYKHIECVSYDPYIEHRSVKPVASKDLVICYNVLQAIEQENMNQIINDLHSLSNRYVILNISIGGFFNRDKEYYDNLFEVLYRDLFNIVLKHTQNTEITISRKNLDTQNIMFSTKKLLKSSFFLLEKK